MRDSRVLYTFAANKSKISPTTSVLLKTLTQNCQISKHGSQIKIDNH